MRRRHKNRPRPGLLPRAFAGALAGVCLMLVAATLHAEPYLAVREGYKCSLCHVNLTGGGKRTEFANSYAQTRLPPNTINLDQPTGDKEEAKRAALAASNFFSGRLNDFISVGADLRTTFAYTSTPTDVSGQNETAHEFFVTKSNLYLEANLIPGRALLYWGAPGGGEARETFALFTGLAGGAYFKAGQFFLPYGMRLHDDTAFIRAETGFTYNATDVGFEVGAEPGPWVFNLALTNGTGFSGDADRNKKLTLSAALVKPGYRVGLSMASNEAEGGDTTAISGLFGGTTFGKFTLLMEADTISVTDATGFENVKKAMFAEMNFLLSRGNNIKLSYDYLDPYDSVAEDVRDRVSLIYEPFIAQFTQLRMGIRHNEGPPLVNAWNMELMFAELHFFF